MNKRRNHCIILSKETIRGKFLYGSTRTHRYFRKIHTILQKGYFMTSCRIKKNAFTGLVLPLLIIMCFSVKYQMRFIFTESNSISAPFVSHRVFQPRLNGSSQNDENSERDSEDYIRSFSSFPLWCGRDICFGTVVSLASLRSVFLETPYNPRE